MSNNPTYPLDQVALISAITCEVNRQHPGLPAKARYINTMIQAANLICNELARPDVIAEAGSGLAAWVNSDRVGLSSEYMAYVIATKLGVAEPFDGRGVMINNHPRDPADFKRCLHMIEVVPAFAPHINLMTTQGPYWRAVVEHWESWQTLLHNNLYQQLYDAMQKAYTDTTATL